MHNNNHHSLHLKAHKTHEFSNLYLTTKNMETTKISSILPSLATDPTISTTETATNFNKEHKRNNEQDNIQHNKKKHALSLHQQTFMMFLRVSLKFQLIFSRKSPLSFALLMPTISVNAVKDFTMTTPSTNQKSLTFTSNQLQEVF